MEKSFDDSGKAARRDDHVAGTIVRGRRLQRRVQEIVLGIVGEPVEKVLEGVAFGTRARAMVEEAGGQAVIVVAVVPAV